MSISSGVEFADWSLIRSATSQTTSYPFQFEPTQHPGFPPNVPKPNLTNNPPPLQNLLILPSLSQKPTPQRNPLQILHHQPHNPRTRTHMGQLPSPVPRKTLYRPRRM